MARGNRVGNTVRWWTAAGVASVLVMGGITGCISGGSHETRVIRVIRGVPTAALDYHVMPTAAKQTSIVVEFARRASRGRPVLTAVPAAPFRECPKVGLDASCGQLIQVSGRRAVIISDHGQGPYDGAASTLVGIVNSSGMIVRGLRISADEGVLAFDGLGLCNSRYRPGGTKCPFGPTGYEGPGVTFAAVGSGGRSGTVTFTPPLR